MTRFTHLFTNCWLFCRVMQQSEHIIRHNPTSTDEIILYYNMDQVSTDIRSDLMSLFRREEFKSFNLKMHTVTEPMAKFCTPYGPPGKNFTFCSTKYDVNSRQERETNRHATVEVVLSGEEPGFTGFKEYYGVTNAHAVIPKEDLQRLSLNQGDFNRVKKMIASELTHLTFFLDEHNYGKVKTLDQPLYSYRREHDSSYNNYCWFETFLHDILIVKLDKDHLRQFGLLKGIEPVADKQRFPLLQQHTTPANKLTGAQEQKTNILGILEVCTPEHVRLLETHQVTIMLLHKTGRVCPPIVIRPRENIRQSSCIYFTLDDGQGRFVNYQVHDETTLGKILFSWDDLFPWRMKRL